MSQGNILIVADYCREDFVSYFNGIKEKDKLYFIYYNYSEEITRDIKLNYGHIRFYHAYRNAFALLKDIQPKKVLFFDIETYNQIALLAACKENNIRSYHVEHGFRDYDMALDTNKRNEYTRLETEGVTEKKSTSFLKKIKNRFFYLSTANNSKYKKELVLYKNFRSTNTIFDSTAYLGKLSLFPDEFISFSPRMFDYHKRIMQLPESVKCHYTGFMNSDRYCDPRKFVQNKKIIFIDTFNHITGLWGITNASVTSYYREINRICVKYNFEFYVKKHPADTTKAIENSGVKIISGTEFEANLKDFCIIAGDYSTLFLVLIGLPHTLGVSFNTFPDKSTDPLKFLHKYKVACEINDLKDLETLLASGDKFYDNYQVLLKYKDTYVADLLFKLDGKANERFTNIIENE